MAMEQDPINSLLKNDQKEISLNELILQIEADTNLSASNKQKLIDSLNTIKKNVNTLQNPNSNDEQKQEATKKINAEVEKLTTLTENIDFINNSIKMAIMIAAAVALLVTILALTVSASVLASFSLPFIVAPLIAVIGIGVFSVGSFGLPVAISMQKENPKYYGPLNRINFFSHSKETIKEAIELTKRVSGIENINNEHSTRADVKDVSINRNTNLVSVGPYGGL